MRCKNCYYSLTGLPGPPHRCPECGRAFDPNDRWSYEHYTRPKLWHFLLLGLMITGGLFAIGAWHSRDSNAFDASADRLIYIAKLSVSISASVALTLWLTAYLRWRRYGSQP